MFTRRTKDGHFELLLIKRKNRIKERAYFYGDDNRVHG
mgnify:CR=1 FL=1